MTAAAGPATAGSRVSPAAAAVAAAPIARRLPSLSVCKDVMPSRCWPLPAPPACLALGLLALVADAALACPVLECTCSSAPGQQRATRVDCASRDLLRVPVPVFASANGTSSTTDPATTARQLQIVSL